MRRERVTDDIYVFTSNLYVQVTAGVVLTTDGAVLIDTLLYPEETLQIKRFVEDRLNSQVRYIINTHHHADHTMGTCFFGDDVQVIAHRLCRNLLDTRGRESLSRTKEKANDMSDVEIVLPKVVFDDCLTLYIGNKTFNLSASPGHTMDSIVCLVEEDQVLFAADTVMAIPYFVDGSYEGFLSSLAKLQGQPYEAIVQGHGDVILRGEVHGKINSDIDYLQRLKIAVDTALNNEPEKIEKSLEAIRIEACGKSHVLLNGAAVQLHRQNVMKLARELRNQDFLQTES